MMIMIMMTMMMRLGVPGLACWLVIGRPGLPACLLKRRTTQRLGTSFFPWPAGMLGRIWANHDQRTQSFRIPSLASLSSEQEQLLQQIANTHTHTLTQQHGCCVNRSRRVVARTDTRLRGPLVGAMCKRGLFAGEYSQQRIKWKTRVDDALARTLLMHRYRH